ncbi:hypothetical protein BKA70DRAFT_1227533 [Coprinopsis sp. MPI-PUGE-AT-0042]|nr:hypothetical protein BKA70DRAFT_1227533 [Coprinopsis sp. MPI-PUGE-AT-0042]
MLDACSLTLLMQPALLLVSQGVARIKLKTLFQWSWSLIKRDGVAVLAQKPENSISGFDNLSARLFFLSTHSFSLARTSVVAFLCLRSNQGSGKRLSSLPSYQPTPERRTRACGQPQYRLRCALQITNYGTINSLRSARERPELEFDHRGHGRQGQVVVVAAQRPLRCATTPSRLWFRGPYKSLYGQILKPTTLFEGDPQRLRRPTKDRQALCKTLELIGNSTVPRLQAWVSRAFESFNQPDEYDDGSDPPSRQRRDVGIRPVWYALPFLYNYA